MCIFSSEVIDIKSTVIISSKLKNDKYRIIYSNKVASSNNNIMVLPINGTDIDLIELPKKYNEFADNIVESLNPKPRSYSLNVLENVVEVKKYGPYDVSLTKNLENVDWYHFGGLNDKNGFINFMNKKYPDYYFLIAKITSTSHTTIMTNPPIFNDNLESKVPICYDYKPFDLNIMMPTYHIHNGEYNSNELPTWDHYLIVINGDFKNVDDNKLILNKSKSTEILLEELINDYPIMEKYNRMSIAIIKGDYSNIDILCNFDNDNKPIYKSTNKIKNNEINNSLPNIPSLTIDNNLLLIIIFVLLIVIVVLYNKIPK